LTTVTVCICTFRNPDGLHALLRGLETQQLDAVRDQDVTVAVVDNDAGASAAPVLKSYARSGRFKLISVNEPKRGLSSARNSALQLAFAAQSDLFAFLDDDEVPSERWLQSLVDCFDEPGNTIVVGPLEPRFEIPPPRWIIAGDFFHHRCAGANEHVEGYTGNVMMRTAAIAASGVRFDETLNAIGGEDVVFFRALRARGLSIKCTPGALAYESIPPGRASLKWMMRRWLRAGATGTLLIGGSNVGRHRIANAARGLGRIAAGSVLVVVTAATRGRRDFAAVAHSISTVCRGVGMLIAAFGFAYQEYGQGYRGDK